MKRTIACLLVLLNGCTMLVWKHPSKGGADLAQDTRECEYEAAKATASMRAGIESGFRKAELEILCLEAKGYRRVPK